MFWASQNAISTYVNDVFDLKCRMITQPFLSTEWCHTNMISIDYKYLSHVDYRGIKFYFIQNILLYNVNSKHNKTSSMHMYACVKRWWRMRIPWTGYFHWNNNRNHDLCRALHNIFDVMLLIIANWILLHE